MNHNHIFLLIIFISLLVGGWAFYKGMSPQPEKCYLIVDDLNEIPRRGDQDCKMITVEQFKERTERY
jgi:hypothetical protein